MRRTEEELRAELAELTAEHNVAIANGLVGKARRFARQIRAVKRKLSDAAQRGATGEQPF